MLFRCLHRVYPDFSLCFAFNAELDYLVGRDMQILGIRSFIYTFLER